METSIRSDLHLEDAGVFINQQLGDMSHHKKIYVNPSHIKKIFANMRREGKDFSRRVTPLFETIMVQANQEEGVDSRIPIDSNQILITTQPSSSRSQKKQSRRKQRKDTVVTQKETQQDDNVPTPSNDPPLSGEDSMQLSELMILCTNLQKQVLDLEKAKDAQAKEIADLKKRVQKFESSEDKDSLGDHKDASKQGRSIEDINKDADVSLVDDTQERSDNEEIFDTNDLHGDEVNVDMPVGEKQEQSAKEREVDTSVKIPKARGVVVQELSEFRTPKKSQPSMIKYKGKVIIIELEVPLKRKDQVALDEDLARNLQAQLEAELIEEERLARKKEEEANIALIDYEEIQKLFDNEMRRVNTFIPIDSEVVKIKKGTKESSKGTEDELKSNKSKKAESSKEKAKGSRKKILGKKIARKEQQKESSKRQRMEDDKEIDEHEDVEVDDEAELKNHLVIVKDDDIAIDAIPLAIKPPVIVEYKLLKEGIMVHYQLIRVDGSSKRYSSMIRMLQGIDREDLETLWKLVKTKHGDTRPEDEHERVLWGDLKVMFEPDIKSDVWRNLQGYKVNIWKLYDSCRVHFVSTDSIKLLLLVEVNTAQSLRLKYKLSVYAAGQHPSQIQVYASFMGFLVYQMDVKSAFLYGTIEEEVYITQPPGFKDPDHSDKVYKVVMELYGLHQAPRAWYETLANYLLGNGFKRGKIDQTLFIKKQKGDILLVHIYVDDIIFGSTNKDLCTGFEKLMKDKFQMTETLKKFNYTDVKSASTPVDLEKPLVKDGDADDVDVHLYRSMIRHVKRGRDTKIPQSSGPFVKVGDETVHKELGNRMERGVTTASSLEVECQDTILGDVDAQTRFETTSKQSNDPPISRSYTLGSGEDSMKLLELVELCIKLLNMLHKNRKSC
ncbi:putative ribonuclease H-like domain-containing protein [Tanacetum coccineum]